MKLKLFCLIAGFVICALITLGISAQEKPREKNKHIAELEKEIVGKENKPAEEVFMNIEIFKGMPAARVLRIMENGFSPALGFECKDCHVEGQWESDDNEHKPIARKMWEMQTKLNQELKVILEEGKGTVNCYTCHRGQEKPLLSPPN